VSLQRTVTARVPAKLNLQLGVGRLRPDGFHNVVTVYHAVGVYDEITAAPSKGLGLAVVGPHAHGVPLNETNLAARAARLLAAHAKMPADVHLTIHKNIPVAAGLAGGSADAAGALVACDALWGLRSDRSELVSIAAELGSDVPFALTGGTAVGAGRGERLTPALARGELNWVLVYADGELSTATIYAACDRLRAGRVRPEPRLDDALMSALRSADPVLIGRALSNDLEPAACSMLPVLRDTLQAGRDVGAIGAIVSGSGPTCAFLARDPAQAIDLAVGLTATGVGRLVVRAVGPVSGARIVDTPTLGASP
jgi:4-diphosphocytidyl-2-C-methyl-D-erythritol kinase